MIRANRFARIALRIARATKGQTVAPSQKLSRDSGETIFALPRETSRCLAGPPGFEAPKTERLKWAIPCPKPLHTPTHDLTLLEDPLLQWLDKTLVAQCSATPAAVPATPPCSATPFQTQISVRHLPGMGGEGATPKCWGGVARHRCYTCKTL